MSFFILSYIYVALMGVVLAEWCIVGDGVCFAKYQYAAKA